MLEHHAHLLTVVVDVQLHHLPVGVAHLLFGDVHAVKDNGTAGGLLQQVQTAQEGGLAGAGGADDHHHVAPVDIHGNTVESLDGAVVIMLFQVSDLDETISYRHGSFSFRSTQ